VKYTILTIKDNVFVAIDAMQHVFPNGTVTMVKYYPTGVLV